ncbi:hypothetical protein WN943_023143 [Citrus x changshan-huyou]
MEEFLTPQKITPPLSSQKRMSCHSLLLRQYNKEKRLLFRYSFPRASIGPIPNHVCIQSIWMSSVLAADNQVSKRSLLQGKPPIPFCLKTSIFLFHIASSLTVSIFRPCNLIPLHKMRSIDISVSFPSEVSHHLLNSFHNSQ